MKVYVVTRCEEHSDYVECAFTTEKEAQEYCNRFKNDENQYARNYTAIELQRIVSLEKACEWIGSVLKANMGYYAGTQALEDFRKAMEN